MMKSVGFFLCIFLLGLLGLLLVSGDLMRWFSGAPVPAAERASREESPPARSGAKPAPALPDPNEIKIPVYDVVHGRLEYTFRGRLEESELANLRDIQELDTVTLRDGQLEVPIYDSLAKEIPSSDADKKPRLFLLTFGSAEYRAFRKQAFPGSPEKSERQKEVIQLHGGGDRGKGTTDDGTEFRFEELVFTIDRTTGAENYFSMRSEKPVSIKNGYLRLESPSGLDGQGVKNRGLQKLVFFPPVRTYLDPRAAQLFSLAPPVPEVPAALPRTAAPPPAPGAPAPPRAESTRAAITCAGPMTFLLDADPKTIRFEKDVVVYDLQGPEPEPGRPPPPVGPTHFDCQLLVIDVDSTVSPPLPAKAVATWEGGRVTAHHLEKVLDGDRLVWSLPPRPPAPADAPAPKIEPAAAATHGTAVLSGKPIVTGEEGRLQTGEVVFKLDEDRILLRGGLSGEFRTDKSGLDGAGGAPRARARKEQAPAGTAKGTAPDQGREPSGAAEGSGGKGPEGAPGRQCLPERWDFRADEGELLFASPQAVPGSPPAGPTGPRALSRFLARSQKEDGVEIKSQDGGSYRLLGQSLEYDARARTVSVEGGGVGPKFQHLDDRGKARFVQLRIDQGVVALRGEVAIDLHEIEGLRGGGGPGGAEGRAAPPAGEGAASPGTESSGPWEVLADELDLRFDPQRRLTSAEGRALPGAARAAQAGSPPEDQVTIKSLAPGTAYRLAGRAIQWNHLEGVAVVEGDPSGSSGGQLPRFEFENGLLLAEGIRFERKVWRVDLTGQVAIQVRGGAAETQPADSGSQGFELHAGRAEVDLNEGLRPRPEAGCGSAKELELVRRIHGWAPPGGVLDLQSLRYRGQAHEATWDSASQELHIFGEGRQELVWLNGGRESTVEAKDIVYRCPAQMIYLNGDVKGEIRMDAPAEKAPGPSAKTAAAGELPAGGPRPALSPPAAAPGKPAPSAAKEAGTAAAPAETLTFRFETSRVDAHVRETSHGLELDTLRARENVLLENERYRLKLTGDDLFYDHERQALRVFSEQGRLQTLTRVHQADPASDSKAAKPGAPKPELKVDQINAREIRLWYRLCDVAEAGSQKVESVVVKFIDDVHSKVYGAKDPGVFATAVGGDTHEEWKLQSDHLGMKLVPSEDRNRVLEQALAEGNVIFSSGGSMATSSEALYEEGEKRLTLRGDPQKPARLIFANRPIANEEISITRVGETLMRYNDRSLLKPERLGPEELRREPKGR